MTFHAFSTYYASIEHGHYPPEAIRQKWQDETQDKVPVDEKGVIDGQKGHKRFRIELEDQDDSYSDSESQDQKIHERGTKAADMKPQDIFDFLSGEATLDFDEDIELPPEFCMSEPAAAKRGTWWQACCRSCH